MGTLVPYERRVRPARYRDVRARSPRGHEVHAARCGGAMGKLRVAVVGAAGTWGRYYLGAYAAHPYMQAGAALVRNTGLVEGGILDGLFQ